MERKFQAIKNSVKGQYGQNSSSYAAVKGIAILHVTHDPSEADALATQVIEF